MEVAGDAPAPKIHDQVTPVDVPVLVKLTPVPTHLGAVEVKADTGVWLMTMVWVAAVTQPN